MKRNKKIVLLAHCFLNVNAKVYGIALQPAGNIDVVAGLLKEGYGIIQLPCVEQSCLGVKRWGLVKEQVVFPGYLNLCRALLRPVIAQVVDFQQNGYEIAAVIGMDGSPSCGVKYTCSGNWGGEIGAEYNLAEKVATLKKTDESGIMIEVLKQMLEEAGIHTKYISVDEKDPNASVKELLANLD